MKRPTDFEKGMIVGILIGEGHFGGDGRQPQITVKMHVRRHDLLVWMQERLPGSKLYGPYEHDGRRFYQLMARGVALRCVLEAVGDALTIDSHVAERVRLMRERYGI